MLSKDAGLSQDDLAELRTGLAAITRMAFARYQRELGVGQILTSRLTALKHQKLPPLERAERSLADCRRFGTLPFAHLARCAFIAMTLLKSAVRRGALSSRRLDEFLSSIHSVSQCLADDAASVRSGTLDWQELIERYGHLRPGTYDIASLPYSARPDYYLGPVVAQAEKTAIPAFQWTSSERQALEALLAEIELDVTVDQFEAFLRRSIEGRESSKLLFSRNLSLALEDIAAFGETVDLGRKDLAELTLGDFAAVRRGDIPASDTSNWLKGRMETSREWRTAAQAVELPPLLCDVDDFWGFFYPRTEPNYITSGRITAPCVDLDCASSPAGDLEGKIIMIARADPGYDWLFGHSIGGLITIFGGANSHMAIRAAEFQLPSAIGIGQNRYSALAGARMIDLDCRARQLVVVA